jgi:hypothetical protein
VNLKEIGVAANGVIYLPLSWGQSLAVYGGPYRKKPEGVLGVKMAKEIALPCAVSIPSADFGVPTDEDLEKGLYDVLKHLGDGDLLYVGCAGGIGRTGTFLAILLKAWGFDEPVKTLRSKYLSHAVETIQQEKLVEQFVISERCQRQIRWMKLRSWLFGWLSPEKVLNTRSFT